MLKKAIVIGGNGFIGSHLVDSLVRDGVDVHVVARSHGNVNSATHVHELDIAEALPLSELCAQVQPDEMYHLAMSPLQMGKTEGPQKLTATNVLGTANVMNALTNSPQTRLVYTGTFTEVGGRNEAIRENHTPQPAELYSITKLAGTLYGQALARNEKRNIVIGRVFTPYGPRIQKGRLVEIVLQKMRMHEPLELTSPTVSRDFVYVEDIVTELRELGSRAEELRGEIFNVGTGIQTTLEQLVGVVASITGSGSSVSWRPEKQVSYDAYPWRANMKKVHARLSWRPQTSLVDGLKRTLEWIRN